MSCAPTRHTDLPSGRKNGEKTKPGQLLKRLKRICADVEDAAPRVITLIEEGRRRAEEQHRKWQAELKEAARRRIEERHVDAYKKSRDGLLAVIAAWGDVAAQQTSRHAVLQPSKHRGVLVRRWRPVRVAAAAVEGEPSVR